jgi:hypothetical protein
MKKISIACLFIFLLNEVHAQTYRFTKYVAAYQNLTNTTSINNGSIWTPNSVFPVSIGFTFNFMGQDFTVLQLTGDGNIFFDPDQYYNFTALAAPWTDKGTSTSLSPLSYTVEGNQSSRILKIEFNNVGFYFNQNTDYFNFQIWLYEGSNICEAHIGPNQVNDLSDWVLSGPQCGVKKTIAPKIGVSLLHNPANPDTIQDPDNHYYLAGTPSNTIVYRFTPIGFTGIDEPVLKKTSLDIYPNPVTDKLYVQSDEELEKAIVYNMLGERIAEAAINAKKGIIETNQLSAGVYLLKLKGRDFERTDRFVKQ